jgi:hypothetical protein
LSPHDQFLDQIFTMLNDTFGGVTYSSTRPAVFHGVWTNPETGQPEPDSSILVVVDALITEAEPEYPDFLVQLGELKARLQQGLHQALIWMTVHPINRIAAHDP